MKYSEGETAYNVDEILRETVLTVKHKYVVPQVTLAYKIHTHTPPSGDFVKCLQYQYRDVE